MTFSPYVSNGLNDCYFALKHIYDNAESYGIDRNMIGIGGDSAGGNYAVSIALRDRNEKTGMVALQVPMYAGLTFKGSAIPGYHFSMSEFEIDPSQREKIDPRIMLARPKDEEHDDEISMGEMYFDDPEKQCLEPYASPLLEKDFTGMPRCLLAS